MEHNLQQEKDFQIVVGNLLRYGVWTALATATTGGVIYLASHSNEVVDFATFKENDRSIFEVINNVLDGVLTGDGTSVIFLGVILLFLTPVLRMFLSLYTFVKEKDTTYIAITLVVIGIIAMSIALGFSH